MEGILSMECKDGRWRPVVFLSKSLNETERNYKIHNKEMLVVVTNFIQLVSSQLVDLFSQTKFHWKASNESYLYK